MAHLLRMPEVAAGGTRAVLATWSVAENAAYTARDTLAEIDSALVKPDAGLPTGLFKMADQLGIDLLYKVMKILEGAFGERLAVPDAIKQLYDSGAYGVKAGKGFYEYGQS